MSHGLAERRSAELVRRCHAGLDTATLRGEMLQRLRRIVAVEAIFFATVDPATLLFTSGWSEAPLDEAASLFLANEISAADVNTFVEVAAAPTPARSLDMVTQGDRAQSGRYREIMAPLGLGDELRVALRSSGATWGVLCLHRADATAGFSEHEIRTIAALAPHFGAGLRHAVMLDHARRDVPRRGIGLVVLDANTLAITSANDEGQRLLDALRQPTTDRCLDVPVLVQAVARRALAGRSTDHPIVPMMRCRGDDDAWLVVHASVLTPVTGPEQVAVVIEPATASDLGSLVLDAHGLTPREQTVAELVLRGCSTRQIVNQLQISPHTVQDHLKSVFNKFGVGSRRELVATLLRPLSQPES